MKYLVFGKNTYLWVVRSDQATMFKLDVGKATLNRTVRDLRTALDPSDIVGLADLPAFDTTKAFELYEKIFAGLDKIINDYPTSDQSIKILLSNASVLLLIFLNNLIFSKIIAQE